MAYKRTFRPDYYFLTMETMHPKPGKAPSRAQSLAISRATTRRWMSLVPSVHNRISISTAPFAQQPAPTTAGPTEIFLRQPAGTTVTNFYKQNVYDPSDNKIGGVDDILIDKEGRVTAVIIGVGGFLGMGEKDVAVPFSSVRASEKNNKW
jgi:sporulation protein YlmC with PRC-barrel domain